MKVETTSISDVKVLRTERYEDKRGFFSETYNARKLKEAGVGLQFLQDNHSLSKKKGTIRGLHFQRPPYAQDKLVRVVQGAILDVAVDIREGSPTYGDHVSVELSASNWKQLLVPTGFAHGFCTLQPETEVVYKVTDFYAPDYDAGIRWDDPHLGIDWPVDPEEAVLSEKDRDQPPFAELDAEFTYAE